MKVVLSLAFILFFVTSCKQENKVKNSVSSIAKGKMPSLATDKNKNVHIVFGSGDSLLYVYSIDGGKTFSAPTLIDTVTSLVANATRGPQVAITANGIAVIAVNNSGNLYSFTKHTGDAWKRTGTINDEPAVDKEGFSGLSSNGDHLFAIWTDLRHDQRNKIFGAQSSNGGQTWSRNILVYASPDSTVCECCKPSVAMQGDNVYVMFRNWLDGNRDLYVIQSADGGNSFGKAEKLGYGSWKLDGCPMDGGGLAVNDNGDVQTVWRRESKIYAAEAGKLEKALGEGKGCSIAIVNERNVYAWTNKDGNIVCHSSDGTNKVIGKGSLPLVKAIGRDAVVCVWQDEDRIMRSIVGIR